MKLIMCPDCNDIVALTRWKKSCKCGKVYGRYVDKLKAKVSPNAILLAIDTNKIAFINGGQFKELTLEAKCSIHDGCDMTVEEFEE